MQKASHTGDQSPKRGVIQEVSPKEIGRAKMTTGRETTRFPGFVNLIKIDYPLFNRGF